MLDKLNQSFYILYMFRFKRIIILLFLVVAIPHARAAITETQALGFGEFALSNNAASHQLVVSPAGVISKDQEIKIISDPQEGVFEVSGFPPSTPLIINITFDNLMSGMGGAAFTISDPTTFPPTVVTDPLGGATFNVGATLNTSGDGGFYYDSDYNGIMTVSVNF